MKPIIKKILRLSARIVAVLLLLIAFFFGIAQWTAYRPEPAEELFVGSNLTQLPDTFNLLTWNIGYAGLGDNMDFFYDGGDAVRDTRARTQANLARIITLLQRVDADVMLLQEVDLSSHRSYGINEVEALRSAFPKHTLTFAYNYKAFFVPIPLREPIGRVQSGMVILSRVEPLLVTRYQYPAQFPWPQRLFNLQRGVLSARFMTANGTPLMINNTHNTAYDTGGMRTQEMHFLERFLSTSVSEGYTCITAGDWNQFPPDYLPTEAEVSNSYFVPQPIDSTLFADRFDFAFDPHHPSLRFLDVPFDSQNVTTLTDFLLLSRGAKVIQIETLPENFRASDHNPVVARIALF